MAIIKSPGVNPTEKLLAELCERSFFKLWSYPNPVKDDGKELCDLLAVFDNYVFVFFVRESRHLDKTGNDAQTNWERWKKRAIEDQARNAHGAERYIRSQRQIFLDNALTRPLPIAIDRDRMIIHKIIVAHGAKEACEQFSDNNVYGSLAIAYGDTTDSHCWPFVVGLDRNRPVHVLDSHNLPIIFGELDTWFDFSSYFDAKIEAIKRFDYLVYCGEEDLLAHYFLNFDPANNRYFIGTSGNDINAVMIGEGEWKNFIQRDAYKFRKKADQDSYFWDKIIQRACQSALDGTLLGEANLLRGNGAIHEMAKEPRFARRVLASAMINAVRSFPDADDEVSKSVSFRPSFYKGKAYVFLQCRKRHISNYDNDYRPYRNEMLEIACGIAKNRFPHLQTIVGIVCDAPKFSNRCEEDFFLMDCSEWPEERRLRYERLNEGFNFFGSSDCSFRCCPN